MAYKKRKNEEYQTLIYCDLDKFYNKSRVREDVRKRNMKIMSSKGKNAIKKYQGTYRVKQRNPNKFKSSSFRTVELCNGVKAVVGVLK